MGLLIRMAANVGEVFGKLINKNVNEKLILNLMNESHNVFPGQYQWVESQSMGECDFIDVNTGQKFDAKLPLTKQQGALIGSRNHDYAAWMKTMTAIESEFSDCIDGSDGVKNVEGLELYKILEERLSSLRDDENAIFFFPYPIVLDAENLMTTSFCMDLLDHIFCELKKRGCIGRRAVYVIYPAIDTKIVLRNLRTGLREYVVCPELDQYIRYRHFIESEEA